jgi:hypothetical protein
MENVVGQRDVKNPVVAHDPHDLGLDVEQVGVFRIQLALRRRSCFPRIRERWGMSSRQSLGLGD